MTSFEVYPINSNGKRTGPSVWVRASSRERAEDAGKIWMRMLGRKKPRLVRADIYRPELDYTVSMYVRKNP
jgi:hypothetical protein